MGLAYEALGNNDEAIGVYAALAKEEPLQLASGVAHSRLIALGRERRRENGGKRSGAGGPIPACPAWIHAMILEPARFVRLSACSPGWIIRRAVAPTDQADGDQPVPDPAGPGL